MSLIRARYRAVNTIMNLPRGGYVGLLDLFPNAAAAYSLRKLRRAYSGAAVRVRRSSDNTEQDIGFDANGDLDTTALTSFVNGATPVLDDYSGAAAAYSLRKLRSAYSGAAVRVRESGGNTEADIGFDANGELDTVALLAHCGVNDGFVTTWYDQSLSNDATQTTAANQPKIVSAGSLVTENGKVAIDFDGTDDILSAAGINQGLNDYAVFTTISTNNTGDWIAYANGTSRSGEGGISLFGSSASKYRPRLWNQSSGNITHAAASSTGQTLHGVIGDRDDLSSQYINGALGNTVDISTYSAIDLSNSGNFTIGSGFGFTNRPSNSLIQEIIFFTSDQSANRTGIEGNIGRYYNIDGYRDGHVSTWYDQSLSNNATQTVAASQPKIVSAGSLVTVNGKTAIDFDGVDDYLQFASGLFVSEHSIFATIKQDNQAGTIIAISDVGGYYLRYTTSNPDSLLWYIPDTTNGTLAFLNETSNQELITAIKSSANVYGYINGGNEKTRPSTGNLTSTPSAIGRYAGSNYFGGYMQELTLYNSNQSANRTGIETNINNFYSIYP